MPREEFVPMSCDYAVFRRGSWDSNLEIVSWHADEGKFVFDSMERLRRIQKPMDAEFRLGAKHFGDIDGNT